MDIEEIKKQILAFPLGDRWAKAKEERGIPHTACKLHAQQDQEMAGREILGRCH